MSTAIPTLEETGLEVIDLENDPLFFARPLHLRNAALEMKGLQRLARAFVEQPENLLQQLVETAIDICGAQSAGISIQKTDDNGEIFYHWIATAGQYAGFLNAILPPFPSACSVCIERNSPQVFRVTKLFFEIMGIDAPVVTDGILMPWQVDDTHGTIWIMAHEEHRTFDSADSSILASLSDFAAMAVRQQRQQKLLLQQTSADAAADMANSLAHKINNPLQSLTNLVYLATQATDTASVAALAQQMSGHLDRLSSLVKNQLSLSSGNKS